MAYSTKLVLLLGSLCLFIPFLLQSGRVGAKLFPFHLAESPEDSVAARSEALPDIPTVAC